MFKKVQNKEKSWLWKKTKGFKTLFGFLDVLKQETCGLVQPQIIEECK